MLVFLLPLLGSDPPSERVEFVRLEVREERLTQTVRELCTLGPRMGGTPSGHRAAAYVRERFERISLSVVEREDPEVEAFEARFAGTFLDSRAAFDGAWPWFGSSSRQGTWPVRTSASAETADPFVLLCRSVPRDLPPGVQAVLATSLSTPDGRYTRIGRVPKRARDAGIAVLGLGTGPAGLLEEDLAAGRTVRLELALDVVAHRDRPRTIVATLPGRDARRFLLFCAHGDSDGGGPGANDNASGVAVVLEIATVLQKWVQRHGPLPWDVRFAIWGKEIHSTLAYRGDLEREEARPIAVLNFDQAGYGSERDAFYVEPDDVPINRAAVRALLDLAAANREREGFPRWFASTRAQGGTDSYVFHGTPQKTYPALTLYTSAWDRERTLEPTPGFEPEHLGTAGVLHVDGDPTYHSSGDTPENTTDREPHNLGFCARLGTLATWPLLEATGETRRPPSSPR